MKCKVCGAGKTKELWRDNDGCNWRRCSSCGSDSSDTSFGDTNRAADYQKMYETVESIQHGGTFDQVAGYFAHIADLFIQHAPVGEPKTFLDVGCWRGGALHTMTGRGWSVHGFDLVKPRYHSSAITTGPLFAACLFPRTYTAVLAAEVVEHVPDWKYFLNELRLVTTPQGVLIVKTPTPLQDFYEPAYHALHVQLFHPDRLRKLLQDGGMSVLDTRVDGHTQTHVCRRIA